MNYNDLIQAQNYWQQTYNNTLNNPQLWQANQQAAQELQKIANMLQSYQSNVGYGNQYQQNYGMYNQQPTVGVAYQPPMQQTNYQPAASFATPNTFNNVPSMQMPSSGDRYEGGRYRKQAMKNYSNSQQMFQPPQPQMGGMQPQQQPQSMRIQPQVQQQPAKPTKHIPGHKWSYLCGLNTSCTEEIQGDYLSYKVSTTGKSGEAIKNVTDKNQEPMCLEKAVNKYNFIMDNKSVAFVDLKFSKTFTSFDLDEIAAVIESVDDEAKIESPENKTSDMKKRLSEYFSKNKLSGIEQLKLISNIHYLNNFFDYRYSRIFNSVAKTVHELGITANNIVIDYESILDYVRTSYDEKAYSGVTHLVNKLKSNILANDKISLTFVEGSTDEDSYLKAKWDYTTKGMVVEGLFFEDISHAIQDGTVDKGKSKFYKITTQSYKELYDILNQCDWGDEFMLYMFTRKSDTRFIGYEIIKGDVGTFYICSEEITL